MNPAQSDLMTIESFQMNGGPFNYESQDYSADPANVAGPGSFPDSDTNGNGSSYDPNGDTASRGHDSSEDGYGDVNSAFIYANEKRFSDFHALFRSVPDDEKLIEDYGCALQKEILVQGRLYISENHLCFNANIFGWVTNLVIAFSEITAIEKRLTAFVIPNAISIMTSTNTKGHFFASFLSRDAAYDLLMAAWRKSFPCAANASALTNNIYFRQNRSNVTLNEDDTNNTDAESFISARPTSDSKRNRHRRSSSGNSQNWTADEADWDEFEDTDGKFSSIGSRSSRHRHRSKSKAIVKKILKEVIAPVIPAERRRDGAEGHSGRGRSVSELPPPPSSYDFGTDSDGPSKARANKGGDHKHSHSHESKVKKPNGGAGANNNNNANSSRAPTTCKCSKDGRHYANTYMSETFPGSVESMWKLLFESDFSKSFLTNEVMKGADVQEEAWQKGADGILTKTTKYTKWLGLPIGPKTTKAILTDVCENKDFDQYVTTVTTTSTPDVPSGGCFTTKCRTCITWAGPNQVKILVTGAVEFTKSSWIKGQIEKGAADGMTAHYKELNQCIRKYIATHPDEFAGAGDTGAPAAVAENKTRTSSSRSRTKSNGDDLASEKAKRAAEVLAPVVSLPVKDDKATKSSSGGMSGILSSIMGMFSFGGSSSSSSDGEGASHVALIAVLVVVMAANLYIWIQISNVTTQIERIQGDVFRGNHHKNNNVYVDHQDQHQHAVGEEDYYYDSYSREQEEAMWAWLTEREERHRQHQRASTHGQGHAHKDWIRASSPSSPSSSSPSSSSYPKSSAEESEENAGSRHHDTDRTAKFDDLSATEAKLQARINELQQQLETLERALESGRM
ncbi:hypothetical protein BGX31_000579 [Mortierella sp. GBA43]|nr:hypothetical protein BGX31_000579 [Mortierella sp. GBA43]